MMTAGAIDTVQVVAAAALVVVVLVAVARFEVFCLDDLAATPDVQLQYLSRTGWFALIVLCIPLGGVLYLYRGKG
jgi:hypothetical protein